MTEPAAYEWGTTRFPGLGFHPEADEDMARRTAAYYFTRLGRRLKGSDGPWEPVGRFTLDEGYVEEAR